jgi:hypothetical protein
MDSNICIIIILLKNPNLEKTTELKMEQPIWHLPKLHYGQSVSFHRENKNNNSADLEARISDIGHFFGLPLR